MSVRKSEKGLAVWMRSRRDGTCAVADLGAGPSCSGLRPGIATSAVDGWELVACRESDVCGGRALAAAAADADADADATRLTWDETIRCVGVACSATTGPRRLRVMQYPDTVILLVQWRWQEGRSNTPRHLGMS